MRPVSVYAQGGALDRVLPRPFKLKGLRLAGKAMDDGDHVPGAMFESAFCAAIFQSAVVLF